jgi:regulator of protease activity HflC (stomatin/prohibitin superfamily)
MLNQLNKLPSSTGFIKKIFVLILILIFGLPLLRSVMPFYSIEYGTVGVVSRFGKLERLASPGLNFKLPFIEKVNFFSTQKIIYETNEQPETSPFYNRANDNIGSSYEQKNVSDSADFPVDTTTKDGQQVSIRFTLRYRLDPEKILWIAENIGTQDQVASRIVQAQSRSITRNIAREFPASELYTGNVFKYQLSVQNKLLDGFKRNGIILDEFLVRQIKFSPGYVNAVEQKQIEQEKVKTEEFKAKQEEFIKQQKIIRSEGEAKSQDILRQTISALVLQKMAIEKWNGVLPTYMGGNGEVPFIGVNPPAAQR